MEIKRKADISYEEFMEEHYKPGIPLVFTNASKVWKANGLFTPEWFKQNFGERTTEKNGKTYTMKEIMDIVETGSADNPAPYPFLFDIPEQLPELLPLIDPLNLNYAKPNWLESKWFKRGYWGSATEFLLAARAGDFLMCILIIII